MTTPKPYEIRLASVQEAAILSHLAFESKAYWGYSTEFMAACQQELTLNEAYLTHNLTFVLENEGEIIGFYALEYISPQEVEFGYLFITPQAIGQGYGRKLINHAKQQAYQQGYQTMVIHSDPNAQHFYQSVGGCVVGRTPSASISGRTLPLMHLNLKNLTHST